MRLHLLFCSLAIIFCHGETARILVVVPTPSYSHQEVFQPVWKELSLRGHNVTVITPNPLKDPKLTNLREIDVSFTYTTVRTDLEDTVTKFLNGSFGAMELVENFHKIMLTIVKDQFQYVEVQEILQDKSATFDLVMYEHLAPVAGAFAHRFKCPLVAITSLDVEVETYALHGTPMHPAAYPTILLPFYKNLTFSQRLVNTFIPLGLKFVAGKVLKDYTTLGREIFGKDCPAVESIIEDVDMLFVNVNPVFRLTKALPPTIVEFGGGVHIRPVKPLPKDIKDFLDGGEFIYFSLGSNVKGSVVNEATRTAFREAFAELPYRVLWKFDEEITVASNTRVYKWLPQQDILRHPNIKAFVTQAGLQSVEEALYSHVPIVAMPYFGDQLHNAAMIKQLGMGLVLDKNSFTKEDLKTAILEVATTPKYKETLIKLERLSSDQPMKGVDKVVWWTEYVIRNGGAKHLRSLLRTLPFYQYYMLDVAGFTLAIISVAVYILFKIVKFCRCAFGRKKTKTA